MVPVMQHYGTFKANYGRLPFGSLFSDSNFLYGMTNMGGVNNNGALFKYTLTTGIAANDQKLNIAIYPNPCSGILNLHNTGTKPVQIEIYTVQGRIIYRSIISDSKSVDLSKEARGIYIVRLLQDNGITSTEKLILNNGN
jgi:hypothetical protein